MAATVKPLLIEYELKFLEKKLKELKSYISANPFSKLDDRSAIAGIKNNKDGTTYETWKIVATREVQRRDLTSALKDYAEIVRTVDQMRTQEAKKLIAVRGDEKLGTQAQKFLLNKERA
jgi:hypothetical protein